MTKVKGCHLYAKKNFNIVNHLIELQGSEIREWEVSNLVKHDIYVES